MSPYRTARCAGRRNGAGKAVIHGASTSNITALSTTIGALKAGTGWLAAPAAGARTTGIDDDNGTSTGLRPSG